MRPKPFNPSTKMSLRGFTLTETMVVVAILAILIALAAPNFTPIIERWRVRQAVENMTSTMYFARSEAIKRGGNIGIQKNAKNTDGCTLADTKQEWGCGWFVFVDSNGNGAWNSGEEKLQIFAPPTMINVMHNSGSENIKVNRWGQMDGLNAKGFTLSPEPAGISSPATQSICVASGGRIRVIEGTPCTP
jgi:type IV fimbrial biogenesis protein FimT